MKQISFNPAHKHLFSEEFITGFNEGAKRQFENDIRPKGKWIQNDNGTYSCSLCQSWIPEEQYHYARFCLHCGADMREVEE